VPYDETKNQLRNLQNVIRLTKENLEALNTQFGKHQHPPSMYLQEYEGLTNKIHDLQMQEQQLQEQLHQDSIYEDSPITIDSSLYYDYPSLYSPGPILLDAMDQRSLCHSTPPPPYDSPQYNSFSSIQYSSMASVQTTDSMRLQTPIMLNTVKVNLPQKMVTQIQVKAGMTLRNALAKGLQRRDLKPEECFVKHANHRPVDWDTELQLLAGQELYVTKMNDYSDNSSSYALVPPPSSLHNFVRKTFFTLAFCHECNKVMMTGMKCQMCNVRMHQRCATCPTATCPPAPNDLEDRRERTKQLLSTGIDYSRNMHTEMSRRSTGPRSYIDQRSTSAPNVNQIHNFNMDHMSLQESRLHFQPSSATIGPLMTVHHASQGAEDTATSPVSSPSKGYSHSAHTSPTNTAKLRPPRARSADNEKKNVRSRRDSNEEWEIPDLEIEVGPRIGSGSFGTVYRGHWHGPVAIKRLNVKEPTPAQMQAFKNEVAVLRKTRHVNILLFMGCTSTPQLSIITQWCEGSSLYKHLHVNEGRFEMYTLIDIARQTAQGMDYMHAKHIIHRDLKSNNIFLTENFCVKIGDFGLATVKVRWSGSHQFQQPTGSLLWMSPEVIRMKDENPYTFKSDVYAFGIVLFELMTGQLPYSHISNKDQILFMVGKGYLKPDISLVRNDSPKAFKQLLLNCINYSTDERPLFPQIVVSLEHLVRNLPRVHRSMSEPTISRNFNSDESDYTYSNASPKTPANCQPWNFPFFSSSSKC